MAPIISLLALFSIALAVVAHPHISRNVHNHAHRGIAQLPVERDSSIPVTLPKKRSLSKRCVPRPANTTSSASTTSASSVPINVAPSPVIPTSSVLPSSSSSSPADTPSLPSPTTSSVDVPPPTQAPPPPPPSSPAAPPPPPPTSAAPPPPPPPTSAAPPPAQTSPSSGNSGEPSFMIGTQSGQGTYYATGLGACGITNNDSQYIVAVSHLLFDVFPGYDGVNPNLNPICGMQVTASYGGQSVTATITDRCTGCQLTDLDFSPSAFQVLANEALGRIDIDWFWLSL